MTREEIMAMDAAQLRLAIADAKNLSLWKLRVILNKDIPDWTTDIAAAWELLEELRKAFFSTQTIMWDHSNTVYVICHPRQGHGENLPELEAIADTAPLAICRAWLMWKASA